MFDFRVGPIIKFLQAEFAQAHGKRFHIARKRIDFFIAQPCQFDNPNAVIAEMTPPSGGEIDDAAKRARPVPTRIIAKIDDRRKHGQNFPPFRRLSELALIRQTVVTHDAADHRRIFGRLILESQQRDIQSGSPFIILHDVAHALERRAFGHVNVFRRRIFQQIGSNRFVAAFENQSVPERCKNFVIIKQVFFARVLFSHTALPIRCAVALRIARSATQSVS